MTNIFHRDVRLLGFIEVFAAATFTGLTLFGLGLAAQRANAPMFFTSIASSGCLILATPGGRFNTNWQIAGGHGIACVAGFIGFILLPHGLAGGALSVAFAILAMWAIGAMHPPAAANPLILLNHTTPILVSTGLLMGGVFALIFVRIIFDITTARYSLSAKLLGKRSAEQ